MKAIESLYRVPFPSEEPAENLTFAGTLPFGTFTFSFKWLNGKWNCWVTLPSGEVRQAGVNPYVPCWTGFNDYGLLFSSALPEITFNSLFTEEMFLIKWK